MKVKVHRIFEDKDILVINKPPNVLSIPDRYDLKLFNIYHHFIQTIPDLKIVHRLDYETSGVMVLAKNTESHRELNIQFQDHSILKTYHALVHGIPEIRRGEINESLTYTAKGVTKIDPKGKSSITYFKTEEEFRYYALLVANPQSGRTHQIRAHLQHLGHPIAGDLKYGGRFFFLSSVKKNYRNAENEKPLMARTALHAFSLEFKHPCTGQKLALSATYPKDLKATLNQLRKLD